MQPADQGAHWIVGSVETNLGGVPQVGTALRWTDCLGTWKARWGFRRMQYGVEPGLYAAGVPTADSPVLVSANYKMSFDRLRSQLTGIDAWILVLDTAGINVWCAAGKGTFGTGEIVRRVEAARLAEVVSHRTLIVPQLGAPGVAAHEVKRLTGFRVVYGPVRAEDLPAFLEAGMTATPEMRQVQFSLGDRLAVAPVELVLWGKYMLPILAGFFFLAGLGPDGYSWRRMATIGTGSAGLFLAVSIGSTCLAPALLPWLPGRAFAVKGLWVGLGFLLVLGACWWYRALPVESWASVAAWCFLVPAMTSFLAMNFTGATTFTSLSGVRLEVAIAGPIQAASALVGAVLWLVGRFL
ncbi:MAG: mercury methylation corrinoid protein HgcA [Planctomycetota bacterium]